jgi:hypothetical protein
MGSILWEGGSVQMGHLLVSNRSLIWGTSLTNWTFHLPRFYPRNVFSFYAHPAGISPLPAA